MSYGVTIDDIFEVIERKKNRGLHVREEIENGPNTLDDEGGSVKVEGKG